MSRSATDTGHNPPTLVALESPRFTIQSLNPCREQRTEGLPRFAPCLRLGSPNDGHLQTIGPFIGFPRSLCGLDISLLENLKSNDYTPKGPQSS